MQKPSRFNIRQVPQTWDNLLAYLEETFDSIRYALDDLNPWGKVGRVTGQFSVLTSPPTAESGTGFWLFSFAATNTLHAAFVLPQDMAEASLVVLWSGVDGNSGNVKWEVKYEVWDIGAIMSGSLTTETQTVANTEALQELSFAAIQANGVVYAELSRLGADAADTYGSNARLIEFGLKYKRT